MSTETIDSKTIQSFFDAIPKQYDLLNFILSFSLDSRWRKKLVGATLEGKERSLLDIGSGTGRSLEAFTKAHRFDLAVGCDFSSGMLEVAKRTRLKRGQAEDSCPSPFAEGIHKEKWVGADLHELPFRDGSFDLVTSSFVLRSVRNMRQFLKEAKRVMSAGGKFAFLELTRPANAAFREMFFRPYLKFYLPFVGQLISKEPSAYRFLSESIQNFQEPAVLKKQMEEARFSDVRKRSYSFGMITIFIGRKTVQS